MGYRALLMGRVPSVRGNGAAPPPRAAPPLSAGVQVEFLDETRVTPEERADSAALYAQMQTALSA